MKLKEEKIKGHVIRLFRQSAGCEPSQNDLKMYVAAAYELEKSGDTEGWAPVSSMKPNGIVSVFDMMESLYAAGVADMMKQPIISTTVSGKVQYKTYFRINLNFLE